MATKPTLKRELGLFEVTMYGLGVIIGAGIYALIGKAAGLAGNSVWASFLIGAFLAAFTGLSYAELVSMFPKAGGEYVYAEHAFGKRFAFLVGWLVVFGGIVAATTVALGFAGYLSAVFKTPLALVAIVLISLLSLLNAWGVKKSAIVNEIGTFVEIAGLIIIVILGFKYIGNVNYFEMAPMGFSGVISATALIFFAFLGFEDIVRLAEETKNPKRIAPLALILAIGISALLYAVIAITAVSVVGWQTLAQSSAPLALVAEKAFGAKAFTVLAIIALFATLTTVLVTLVASSRILYGMSKDGGVPKIFGAVSRKYFTPWVAVVFVGAVAALFALFEKIEFVAAMTDFALFATFAIVNLALIVLRYHAPNGERQFKSPLSIGKFPVLAAIGGFASIFLMFQLETKAILAGFALIGIGILVFELKEHFKIQTRQSSAAPRHKRASE